MATLLYSNLVFTLKFIISQKCSCKCRVSASERVLLVNIVKCEVRGFVFSVHECRAIFCRFSFVRAVLVIAKVVNILSVMGTPSGVSRDQVLQLIAEKESMENQLLSLYSVLSKNGVGMTDPLVDSEDYPRSDIDVYEVRAARQRIICLRNDLRNMMVDIEEKLHALHASSKDSIEMCTPTERANIQPVAKVAWVAPHSPADRAGLVEGDEIVEFGSLNTSNFRSISDFSVVVQNSVGRKINVKIKRMGNFVNVHVIPASWQGGGLLGCKIVELIENTM